MNLVTNFLTNNDCYKTGRTIKPTGIMVHSTAAPGKMAAAFVSDWNKSGVEKCVHAFVDNTGVYQTLPWNHRGWHSGTGTKGTTYSANNNYIGFEICEPAGIVYNSSRNTIVGYDVGAQQDYFNTVWNNAVELCVMLCKEYGLNESNILCHSEGYKAGIASNHADVMHWFPKHNKSMDDFRAAVKVKLVAVETPAPTPVYDVARENLLRVVAAESRGEPYEGQMAVAQCIRDRVNDSKQRFGKGLEGVLRPGQFAAPWQGDLNTVPSVVKAVETVFNRGESAFPQAVLWFLGRNANETTKADRDAKYVFLGTISNQSFWGDEKAAQPAKPKNPYATPPISKKHMLRKGSNGDEVRWLQWILNQLGYDLGKWGIDGDFGGQTEKAVKAFQRDHGLDDDGIVGVNTFGKLN